MLIITWRHSILLPRFFLCVPGTVNSAKVQKKDEFETSVNIPKGNVLTGQTEALCLELRTAQFSFIQLFGMPFRSLLCVYVYEGDRERERDRNTHTQK